MSVAVKWEGKMVCVPYENGIQTKKRSKKVRGCSVGERMRVVPVPERTNKKREDKVFM